MRQKTPSGEGVEGEKRKGLRRQGGRRDRGATAASEAESSRLILQRSTEGAVRRSNRLSSILRTTCPEMSSVELAGAARPAGCTDAPYGDPSGLDAHSWRLAQLRLSSQHHAPTAGGTPLRRRILGRNDDQEQL